MEINFFLIEWLEWIVSWILVSFHTVFTGLGLGEDSGWAWGLSIVGLVVVIRIVLIPLFVKQIKAQRGLQLIQPKMKEIQKRYAGDRERQSQELMKLYKETGTNPLASCLPILLQAPIFFALFQVLNGVAKDKARGVLTPELVDSAREATIFGAPIADTFTGADTASTRVVVGIMILLMTASTFITQRQLMVKNMPKDNPMAQQQKILLYVFPLMFAVFGINFPVGVLVYWLTTNVWSMGQQFYVIRNMPAPGTEAEKAYLARKAAREAHGRRLFGVIPLGGPTGAGTGTGAATASPAGADDSSASPRPQRQQPRRQPRSKRRPPSRPASDAAGSSPEPAGDRPNGPQGIGRSADRPGPTRPPASRNKNKKKKRR